MEIESFIEKFAEQFEETDTSTFNADTDFRALDEWSSYTALAVMAMVCEEYEVMLSADQMRSVSTIGQLFELTKSLL